MPPESRPSADQLTNKARARRVLERLDKFGHLAESWERETFFLLRQGFAERYQRLFGIHPSRHREFRTAVEDIRSRGLTSVEDVAEYLKHPSH